MEERIERTALKHLIHTEQYARKVLPFLKEEYFSDRLEKLVFREISLFYEKYNAQPTNCLLYTSPSPRDLSTSRMPSSA